MNCPDDEKLVAYVGGELDGDEVAEVLAHVRACPECRQAASELLALHRVLNVIAKERPCPSPEQMLAYLMHNLSPAGEESFKKHLHDCLTCRIMATDLEVVGDSGVVDLDPANQQKAKVAALAVAESILPSIGRRFERLWEQAMTVLPEIIGRKRIDWNASHTRRQVIGALGAGAAEPATIMSMVAILTSLAVAFDWQSGRLSKERDAIREAVKIRARELGAGKGLIKKLCQVVPESFLS